MTNFTPTADDLILLGAAQRNNQKRLDALSAWSEENAEDAIMNVHVWNDHAHEWSISTADLARLAFDIRMPAEYATLLQQMAQWGRDNNQEYINPKAKPNNL